MRAARATLRLVPAASVTFWGFVGWRRGRKLSTGLVWPSVPRRGGVRTTHPNEERILRKLEVLTMAGSQHETRSETRYI